jgi:hypothetical protein
MKTIIAGALALMAASSPSLADSQSAAGFVLKICLPAMDELAKVDIIARENNWIALPPTPVRPGPRQVDHGSNWRMGNFFVHTWVWLDGNLPTCFVGLHGENADRDEFLQAISASFQLKQGIQVSVKPQLRLDQYEINIGSTKLELITATMDDGMMSSARISKKVPSPSYGFPDQ